MNNDNSGEERMTDRAQSYQINFELVATRKKDIQEQLNHEGIGRREVIEQESGRERLRDLVWNDPAELSLIERCQLLQELLHELAMTSSAVS
jgi:hypothetical protein